ncbi:hypothetical protein N8590_00155, partial [bacterium]|nr:hypothetical protein [bacterium]
SHPTIISFNRVIDRINVDGNRPSSTASRVNVNNRPGGSDPNFGTEGFSESSSFNGPMGPMDPMGTTRPEDLKELNRTDFTIEFAWKPVPREERVLPEVESSEEVPEDVPVEDTTAETPAEPQTESE